MGYAPRAPPPAAPALASRAVGSNAPPTARTPPSADPELQRLVALLADPATPTRDLLSGGGRVARAVWDADRHRILLFAGGLPPPAPGKRHVLWLLSPVPGAAPANAGALRRDPILLTDLVLADAPFLGDLAGLAVSEESDPSARVPGRVLASTGE